MAQGNGLPKMTQSGGGYPAAKGQTGPGRPVPQSQRDYKTQTPNQATQRPETIAWKIPPKS